jgi:tRNA-2-methylthio-N6-dimethylallyladenosine synthase
MKYFVLTFGCQMNVSDSKKIAVKLQRKGYSIAKNVSGADLIVLNACSVRQSAIDRIYGQIQKFPDKKILIAGCLLDYDKKGLAAHKNVSIWQPDDYFDLLPLRADESRTFVPIMTGCNNFCSYCVVPFTRGREKSRPANEIIKEIKSLIKNAYKEIILVGQNVNSYKDRSTNFSKLLKKINDLPGNFRLNFLTSHPKDMSDELIETMTCCQKLIKEIHLPVQSGDDQILKKMNRRYTVAHYKNLIKTIRQKMPDIKISTDIIVGFPGETKKQFQNTVKLAKEVTFDKAYIAKYSPRPGTAAAKLVDDITSAEKTRRWRLLDTLINKFEH